ncbi:MAG: LL-diaminopimelate aminotransferase [Candidatus Aquicultor secundus]|uniref:Aminotransferase n=1 Tax=Candidatus Aquicultor secundus TaxID=1973895 RepID=A0A2M7T9J9_9ACTN|nr:LL-diaminopimelate aminotransferase [Candidatus Aquicultor secundus]NCO65134.1 aminotransferase class I/II-fold pyridoxal phosphate-dependent enzyme [Solirubrobacter sp.]OIO87834.1 MAG: LL-diaminopimelate aminotransferase [Candidatus Aquicultor secundus]PIU27876.1 MAG: LL-diaminopimelate aminotransferase [Candidatus Aquicultor secundus]PIW22020.1 MAG: LL-diaminopimelate aminotransferase [Candidatus Aquicultor secundus]PIX52236.1 MAG: LL-diaminopimelate aminotransferase [Candidatus Aquiculto
MKLSRRIDNLPPYLFAEIDKKVAEKRAQGVDVISLGIGDPVEPTPQNIIDKLCEEANHPANHRYPSYYGLPAFRRSVADWYKKRFDVDLDPDTEVLPLIGSKEGLAHIDLAVLDPGDVTLIADPGYPNYTTGAILAGVNPVHVPLVEENDFLPDLEAIDAATARDAKMFLLNYPNNPTSAIATDGFFNDLVAWADKNRVIVGHDNPYSEITFDGYVAPSFLQYPGAKDVGVEFHSLSKTYNMTGWRIGWVCGNAKVVEALGRVKTHVDSGIFNAIQYAGIEALEGPQDIIQQMREIYARRRDMVMEALGKIGLSARTSKATIYVWVKVPEGYTSASFATHILNKAGVVVSPGNAYGPSGEGFIRICLSVKDDQLAVALQRIKDSL